MSAKKSICNHLCQRLQAKTVRESTNHHAARQTRRITNTSETSRRRWVRSGPETNEDTRSFSKTMLWSFPKCQMPATPNAMKQRPRIISRRPTWISYPAIISNEGHLCREGKFALFTSWSDRQLKRAFKISKTWELNWWRNVVDGRKYSPAKEVLLMLRWCFELCD